MVVRFFARLNEQCGEFSVYSPMADIVRYVEEAIYRIQVENTAMKPPDEARR